MDLDQPDDWFLETVKVTFSIDTATWWRGFQPLETSAWPTESSGLRLLGHLLVEQLPPDGLPELIRTVEGIVDYYSRPVSVTPQQVWRSHAAVPGIRSKPPVLELTEA